MSIKKLLSVATSFVLLLTVFSVVPFGNYASGATIYDSNKVSYTESYPQNNKEAFANLGASVVAGKPSFQISESLDKGATWGTATPTAAGDVSCLYDADTSKDMKGAGFKGWASHDGTKENGKSGIITEYHCGDSKSNKRYRFDITYDLKAPVEIKNILLIHANLKGNNPLLRTGHYALYASNSLDTLFNSENQVFEFKNEGSATVPLSQTITFKTSKTAQYVAARIYNPYATSDFDTLYANSTTKEHTNCYVRLLEFNIFGNDTGYSISRKFMSSSAISGYTSTLQKNKNLIKGNHCIKSFVYRDTNLTDSTAGTKYPLVDTVKENGVDITSQYPNHTALTDDKCDYSIETRSNPTDKGLFSKGTTGTANNYYNTIIDDEDELYYQFNYKLDDIADISGISLIGHPNELLTPSHFKYSIANSEDALFTDSANYNSPDLYTNGNINEITFKNAKSGRYVGFRIICGVGFDSQTKTNYQKNQLYLRMAEFCVYGTYQEYVGSLTQYSKIAPLGDMTVNAPATIEYLANPDANGRYPKDTKVTVKAQASVRYDRDIYRFLHWIDNANNGAIISQNLTLENISLPRNLTAIYGKKDVNDTVKYTFTDKFGKTLYTANVGFGDYLSKADYEKANLLVPDLAGYDKLEEKLKIGSRTATVQMWSSDIYNVPAEADITVSPLYKVSDTTYKVSTSDKDLTFDTRIDLASNKNWYVNGAAWHASTTSASHTYIVGDMDITSGTTKTYGISLYNPSGKNSPTLQGGNFTAFAKLNLESGSTIAECGIIFLGDNNGVTPTTSSFVLGSEAQKIIAKTPNGTHFSCTLKGVGKNRTRYARAYVKYKISSYSSQKTIYSNIICITTK